ncbi:MAG TPA: MerR family transcriptional regulator [Mycobacteriales bacterium]|nr:MerR family transcriptional regulator [Mycobacteriales bacterium]
MDGGSRSGSASAAFLSIGQVLGLLRADFADITISKIRFLEAEGLVEPRRTASGYRKFSREDVARLRYVLGAQRDQYLPLRVIKEHLEAIDRGLEPPAQQGGPRVPRALVAAEGLPDATAFRPEMTEIRLSRQELMGAAGLTSEQLDELEEYGLLAPRPGGVHYDGDALIVAKTVAQMAHYGMEARHLRSFKTAAEREIGLLEQVVTPLVRQRNPEARARAEEVARELAALSVKLHATLVRAGLGPALRR